MSKVINPEIFRESDIRGIVQTDLLPDYVESIGKAIGTLLKRAGGRMITLGHDVRPSSKLIRNNLMSGLLSTGCHIIDIGTVPTPVSYYSQHLFDSDGGVMITGSHNPSEFNGFKISIGKNSIYGEKILELYRMIVNKDFDTGRGIIEVQDISEFYIQEICKRIHIPKSIRTVVDGGNGCFGLIGPRLFKRMGIEPFELYCEPDGTFPNHHPDPTTRKNLAELRKKVLIENADVGVGFDGDVDRIGVVDDNGDIIWGDYLLILFARYILSKSPGATIVGEVKCSQNLFQDIRSRGGIPVMTSAGHSLIKKKMRDTGALLAGEMSGHIFFADDYYGYDDAIYAACRLFQILAQSDMKLSELLTDLPKTYYTPEIRIDCPDNQKFRIVEEVAGYFKSRFEVLEVDGARINFEDGWAIVRASNTQPVLVLRFEAQTAQRLNEYQELLFQRLEQYDCIEIDQITAQINEA